MGLLRRLIKKAQTDFGVYSLAEEIALNSPQNIQRGDDYKRMFLNNGVKPAELEELGLNELFKQDRVNQREILDTISENRIEFEVAEYKGSAPTNHHMESRDLSFDEAYEGSGYLDEEIDHFTRDEPDLLFSQPYQAGGDIEEFAKRLRSSDAAVEELNDQLTQWWERTLNFDELPDDVQTALEVMAEQYVRSSYDFDPVTEVRLYVDGEPTDYALINQEGAGDEWFPRGDAPPFLRRHFTGDGMRGVGPRAPDVSSLNEAEVQLEALALDMGEISFEAEDGLRWGEHTLPGGENAQELVFKLKLPEIRFEEDVHYPDQYNQVFHVRTKDRFAPDGDKILFIEEFQSDWGQTGRNFGFVEPDVIKAGGAEAQRIIERLAADIDVSLESLMNLDSPNTYFNQLANVVGTGKIPTETVYRGELPPEVEIRSDQLNNFRRLIAARRDIFRVQREVGNRMYSIAKASFLSPEYRDNLVKNRIARRYDIDEFGSRQEMFDAISKELQDIPIDESGNFDVENSSVRGILRDALRQDPELEQQIIRGLFEREGGVLSDGPTIQDMELTLRNQYLMKALRNSDDELEQRGLPRDFIDKIDSAIADFERDPTNKKALEMTAPNTSFQNRAPFVTSSEGWNRLGIKYIFNKAAEEGYDGVAFSPGQVQYDRWGREGLIDAYDKTIPFAISKVINPATPDSNKPKLLPLESADGEEYSAKIYRFEDPTKDGKTIADKSQRATMFSAPIGAGVIGLQALSPEEAAAQEVTAAEAETMMRVPEETGITNIFSDIGKTLYGAGEVAYEGLSDLLLEPLMGMAGAEAAFEKGASPEEIEEARKRTIGLIDFETQSPQGRELKERALQGLGSLGEYLMEPTREYDPYYLKAMFQEGLVPATEAMTEAGLGIIGLDPRDTPEQERIRKEAARPVVEAVQPL